MIRNGRPLRGTRMLRGTGNGLTPSGDDVIAGFLWGVHAVNLRSGVDITRFCRRIQSVAFGENLISNQTLTMAGNGWFPGTLKNLVTALGCGDEMMIRQATRAVSTRGALSGSDLCAGVLLGISYSNSAESLREPPGPNSLM